MKLKPFIVILAIFFSTAGCGEIGELEELLNDLKVENEMLLTELELLNSRLDEYDTKLSVILASLEENADEMEALKEKVDSLTAQLIEQLAKIDALKVQLNEQGADIDKLTDEIQALKDKCDELKALIEELLGGKSPIPTEGLVAWYPFNGNADDESGNGNNGRIENSPTLGEDREGVINSAYFFDWTNVGGYGREWQKIELPRLIIEKSFSISLWFKPTGFAWPINPIKARTLIAPSAFCEDPYSGSFAQFALSENNDITFQPTKKSSSFTTSAQKTAKQNEWQMITITMNSESIKLYHNGELKVSQSHSLEPSINSCFSIGLDHQSNGHWYYFHGGIDDIGFWDRPLTEDEILKMYNGEKF